MRSVAELKQKSAYKIARGPHRGEMTLIDYYNTIEVVDEVSLRTLRTLVKNQRPIEVLDMTSFDRLRTIEKENLRPDSFALSPDGIFLAWHQQDKSTFMLQEMAGGTTAEFEVGSQPGAVALSPDSKLLAIGETWWDPKTEGEGFSRVKLFDPSGKLVRTLAKSGPAGNLMPIFSPNGKTLAVGNGGFGHKTFLFEVSAGTLLRTLDRSGMQEVSFSPDGKTLAAGYSDGSVVIWDVGTGKLLQSNQSGCEMCFSVDWSPKGDVLCSSGKDGKIVLWEPAKMTKLKEFDAAGLSVMQVRFTSDGTHLIASSTSKFGTRASGNIVVWAVPNGGDQ